MKATKNIDFFTKQYNKIKIKISYSRPNTSSLKSFVLIIKI